MSDFDPYNSTSGDRAHPQSSVGGGGTGVFRAAGSMGGGAPPQSPVLHPSSPVARHELAQGAKLGKKPRPLPPAPLDIFSNGIGSYSAAELTDALYTVYGEISNPSNSTLRSEADAVASTIFNRLARIQEARTADAQAQEELKKAKANATASAQNYEQLAKNPTAYKRAHGDAGYTAALDAAHAAHQRDLKALGAAQKAATATHSQKMKYESYVAPSRASSKNLTLTDIVDQPNQYVGYPKGKKDYGDYPGMPAVLQRDQLIRWNTAKAAVSDLAQDASKRLKYEQFRASRKPTPAGRTQIGGNDFF